MLEHLHLYHKQDIKTLAIASVLGSVMLSLYSSVLWEVLAREKVFIRTQSEIPSAVLAEGDRRRSLAEILAKQPNTVRSLTVQKPNLVSAGASYLLIGDSMMQDGIGSELENSLLSGKVSAVHRKAIQSTGLLHPERLNWYAEVDRLLASRKYDVVIIMLGLNDADHMTDSRGVYQMFGTDEWKVAYAQKVEQMLHQLLVKKQVKKVVWVGLPVAPDKFWDHNVRVLNDVYKTVASRYVNAMYVDTYDRFKVNGKWSAVVKDNRGNARTARQEDGLHMTIHGGRIVADLILDTMKKNDIQLTANPK